MRHFQADLEKYYRVEFGNTRPTFRQRLKLWMTNLGLHCIAVYRLGQSLQEIRMAGSRLVLAAYIPYELACFLIRAMYHVDIFAASIGPGFYIGHVGTIYIGRCSIGANCSVTHNVTIGQGFCGDSYGLPTLGDDVWIGAGATLYGKIRIGNGVTINCGSILSRSLPDKCLAGGNPARVLLLNHENQILFRNWRESGGNVVPAESDVRTESPAEVESPAEIESPKVVESPKLVTSARMKELETEPASRTF